MSGASDPMRLAELLCARISHDLSSTIGALSGALEMSEDPAVAAEALELASEATAELRCRLELQRAAWGPTGGSLDLAELRRLTAGLPYGRRCTVDLTGLRGDTVFSPRFARMVLNLLLLSGEALNGSGVVSFAGSSTDLVVAITGPRAAWPASLARCLASEAAAWALLQDAKSLQMPLTLLLARALRLRLTLLIAGGPGGPAPPLRLCEV